MSDTVVFVDVVFVTVFVTVVHFRDIFVVFVGSYSCGLLLLFSSRLM